MGKASSLSTKKRLRQSKKRHMTNKANRTRVKSQVKKVRIAAESGATTEKTLPATYSIIDKAVHKGVLTRNAAARHKSRITKLINSKV